MMAKQNTNEGKKKRNIKHETKKFENRKTKISL